MVLDLCICISCFTGETDIIDRGLVWHLKNNFLQAQLFTAQDVNWWTGVMWITGVLLWCFYQPFRLSFWRYPFTADDPFVSRCCKAKLLQFCSDEETNSIYILEGLRVNVHFLVTFLLKMPKTFLQPYKTKIYFEELFSSIQWKSMVCKTTLHSIDFHCMDQKIYYVFCKIKSYRFTTKLVNWKWKEKQPLSDLPI